MRRPVPENPDLSFLHRRPPLARTSPDAVRTGDLARDLSAAPVRTHGAGVEWSPPDLITPITHARGRVALSPTSPSIRLGGEQSARGALDLTLTWRLPPSHRGVRRSTDIHLGCLWQATDGRSGCVQSHGGHIRAPMDGPALLSLGPRTEDRGETLTLALAQASSLARLVIYVYAISGRPQWQALEPVVTASLRDGARIESRVGVPPGAATICALLSVHRVGSTLVLRREGEYLRGQQSAVSTAYGFDLPWSDTATMPGR